MAIVPSEAFPGQTIAPTSSYPLGSARDVAVTGDGTGTPWKREVINDVWGFFQSLLADAGVTASGIADRVGASQYMDSLYLLFPALARMVAVEASVADIEPRIVDDEWVYPAPKARTTVLRAGNTTGYHGSSGVAAFINEPPGGSSYALAFDLGQIPHGAVITRIRALVKPGAARTGSDRMGMWYGGSYSLNFDTPAFSGIAGNTTILSDDTSNVQSLDSATVGLLSLAVENDAGGSFLYLAIFGGIDAATNPDRVYGAEITWTDPGPRNF